MQTFQALRIHTHGDVTEPRIDELTLDDLDQGEIVIRTAFSGVGYRDAMAAKGIGRNIRTDRPCVGGVDVSGIVESSSDPRYQPGDRVLVTNYAFGISHDGAFSEYARVRADWVVPLPDGLTLRESMILGSSGLTAAVAIERIAAGGVRPQSGPVIVTGSTGGVGSIAVDLLSKLGYTVTAVTGKAEGERYLRELGATEVLPRSALLAETKTLGTPKWAGAVDNVGGVMLERIASTMLPHGRVALCGLAADAKISTTVMPFILRAIDFLGINVGRTFPMSERVRVWGRLGSDLKPRNLDRIARPVRLPELPAMLARMYEASVMGRVIVETGGDLD